MPGTTRARTPRFEDRFGVLAALSYKVAFRLTGDRPEAEDLCQEALTRAYASWRRVADYDEAWVARVTTNLVIGRWRRRGRVAAEVGRPAAGRGAASHRPGAAPLAADRLASDRRSSADDPLAVVERLELVAALRGLPRRQREVVALRYLADLSEADVAGSLGCSVGAVKQHAHRGLAALRERLDHLRPGPRPDVTPQEGSRVRAPR